MNFRLAMLTVPVADVDRAKAFYAERVGFRVEQDVEVDDGHRFVELVPPGSDCSIALTTGYVDAEPGSLCWHAGGTTDSYGPDLRPVTNGLRLIPTSNGVHYDSEEQRRPLYHRLVADGTLPGGHATDDGVGLVYRGTELVEAVADRPDKAAYRVQRGPDGAAVETRLEPRRLR